MHFIILFLHVIQYRIARNFRGLKFSRIGRPEDFRDFIFADGRFEVSPPTACTLIDKNFEGKIFAV